MPVEEPRTGEELTVITLCGSMRFRDELERLDAELTLAGHVVLAPAALDPTTELSADERARLGRVHLAKVAMADEVLVVNIGGYVGESTRREIEHARSRGIRVNFLEPPAGDHYAADRTSPGGDCRIRLSPFVVQVEAGHRVRPDEGAGMTEYLIYFNQQWVGDHSGEWFASRAPLAMGVVNEMKAAGVYVFAGGLDEDTETAFSADATSGTLSFSDGPYAETKEYLGGLTVVDVPDEEAARMWAGKLAEACGWPQEVRRFKPQPEV